MRMRCYYLTSILIAVACVAFGQTVGGEKSTTKKKKRYYVEGNVGLGSIQFTEDQQRNESIMYQYPDISTILFSGSSSKPDSYSIVDIQSEKSPTYNFGIGCQLKPRFSIGLLFNYFYSNYTYKTHGGDYYNEMMDAYGVHFKGELFWRKRTYSSFSSSVSFGMHLIQRNGNNPKAFKSGDEFLPTFQINFIEYQVYLTQNFGVSAAAGYGYCSYVNAGLFLYLN